MPIETNPSIIPALKQLEDALSDVKPRQEVTYSFVIKNEVATVYGNTLCLTKDSKITFCGQDLSKVRFESDVDLIIEHFPAFVEKVQKQMEAERGQLLANLHRVKKLTDLYRSVQGS